MTRCYPPVPCRAFCRPLRPALSRTALWSLAGAFLAAGCSRTPVTDLPPPVPAPGATEPPLLGVALLEPASDVADLTEAVRHVVGPRGVVGVEAPIGAPAVPAAAAATTTEGVAHAAESGEALPPGGTGANGAADTDARPAAGDDSPASDPDAAPPPGDADPDAATPARASGGEGAPPASADVVSGHGPVARPAEGDTPPAEAGAGLTPGTATQDAILAAWERYCVTADLTPEEWGIIDRSAMPAALEAQWAERCRPEK